MATTAHRPASSAISGLLLKVTPARVPRDLLIRKRLSYDAPDFRDRPAIVVQAPAGFGKTSLLAQWRREHLARGTVVAWLSAQQEDDTAPLRAGPGAGGARRCGPADLRAHAARRGRDRRAGRRSPSGWPRWRKAALDIVLIVDEADRLPAGLARGAGLPAAQRAAEPAHCRRRAARVRPRDRRPGRLRHLRDARRSLAALPARRDDRAGAQPAWRPHRRRYRRAPARADRGLAARPAARAVGDQPQHATRRPRSPRWRRRSGALRDAVRRCRCSPTSTPTTRSS